MSKKSEYRKKMYSTKMDTTVLAKRYLLILVIALPIIMFINFFLANEVGISTVATIFITLALFLFAILIGIIIYAKKDDKKRERATKETERDPFAD